MKIIELNDTCAEYKTARNDKKFQLKNLSFYLEEGQALGIVGPNGHGKTTIIKTILDLLPIKSGKLTWKYGDFYTVYRNIGVQLQDTSYSSKTKIKELINITTKFNTNWDWISQNQKMLKIDTLDKYFDQYSKGQRQKIDLLLAIAKHPETLILDEITSNLDPLSKLDVIDFLKEWKLQKRSIIITSHYLEELEEICDRLIFIRDGEIIDNILMKDIKKKYKKIIHYYKELYQ